MYTDKKPKRKKKFYSCCKWNYLCSICIFLWFKSWQKYGFFGSRLLWVKVVKIFPRLWQTVINQPSVHRGKTRGGSSFIGVQVYIVSTWKQPRGSIFQNGFLGGSYSKNPLKIWLFLTKAGVYSRNGSNGLNSSNGTNASNRSNGSNYSNNSYGSNPTLIVTVSLSIHEC